MQLMYLGKKYMLPSLVDRCSAYLQQNLNASNVFHVLPAAQKYEEKELLDHCWKVIEKETEEVVKSDGFVTTERSVLEELVEKDSLNIKEVELFKAVDCWTGKECEKQGLAEEGSVKRRILGERIVKGIRFPVMAEKDFADVVLDSDMLTRKETCIFMKYFNSVLKTPVGFSEAKRNGHSRLISRFRSLEYGWQYSSGMRFNTIAISVDKNIKLHAVRLFGSENNEYSVKLRVQDVNEVVVATGAGDFLSKLVQSEIGNYQGFEIVFDPPIALQGNREYSFVVEITGPPSWFGVNGRSCVVHSGVKFSFCKYWFEQDVEEGQFSEFLFTLD